MTKKDKAQTKRFIDKARELEADETGKRFERALGKIVPPKRRGDPVKSSSKKSHRS